MVFLCIEFDTKRFYDHLIWIKTLEWVMTGSIITVFANLEYVYNSSSQQAIIHMYDRPVVLFICYTLNYGNIDALPPGLTYGCTKIQYIMYCIQCSELQYIMITLPLE